MKNKLIAVSLLMVAVAILVRVGIVRANARTITEVCKTNGGILMAKENCPGGSEKWTIGGGEDGQTDIGGESFFISNQYFLDKNGYVWGFSMGENNWERGEEESDLDVKDNVYTKEGVLLEFDVGKIVKWNEYTFIDNENNIYRRTQGTDGEFIWIKVLPPPVVE